MLLWVLNIPGCLKPLTPQDVAENFWKAVKAHDSVNAYRYSTADSQNSIDLLDEDLDVTEVTFGKIVIDGERTTIETTIRILKNGSEEVKPLQTILIIEEDVWRVDFAQTKATLPVSNDTFTNMLENIREFGDEFSEKIGKTLDELKQKIPDIENKLNEMGSSTSEKIRKTWEQYVPEIKNKIEELGKALEDALKKEGNNNQDEKSETSHPPDNSVIF